jgi:hypothetical protein
VIESVFRHWFDVENVGVGTLWLASQGLSAALSALWQQRLPAGQYITSLSKLNHLIYYAMQISRNLP